MLVFNGGLTIEQVEKLKSGKSVIYDKVPYKEVHVPRKNTFEYVPKQLYNAPLHIVKQYISDDCYAKQYLFFARSLKATFEFCRNSQKKNYIIICDIEEKILNDYIGVGNYVDYRIEYRLPRIFITPNKIKDILYFEPYDESQMVEFQKKYETYYDIAPNEDEMAKELILKNGLEFNEHRVWK